MFENFRNKCLEKYENDPIYFVSAPGLAWQACLKKAGLKLDLITDYDTMLMIEKEIRVEFVKQHIGIPKQTINI